jgi:uncharacterized protein (TIGR02996 family)
MSDDAAFRSVLDELIRRLQERPEDAELLGRLRSERLVYADWLDEQARPDEAAAQRWLGAHGKWPKWCDGTATWDWWCEADADDGWRTDEMIRPYAPEGSLLPDWLDRHISLERYGHGVRHLTWKGGATTASAETAVAAALRLARPGEGVR